VGRELRQAEVQQLHARLRQHHVAGLEVAVDDALLVRGGQRLGNLRPDLERLRQRQRALLQPVGERFAGEVLHDEVGPAILLPHVVERTDVGVLESGDGPRLALEAGPQRGSEASSAESTLRATVRSRRVSRAR
jgi:hypothetical protein